jgi:tetratricopeptide (TPR) repeat protein
VSSYSFGQHVYAVCLLARGEMEEAQDHLELAVDLAPLSVLAHRSLGWMLYLARRFASAEKWLQAALVLDRELEETHYLLAQLYISQHRLRPLWSMRSAARPDRLTRYVCLCLGLASRI